MMSRQLHALSAHTEGEPSWNAPLELFAGNPEARHAIAVANSVDVLLAFWDRGLRCKFANSAFQVWFGRSRAEMLGISLKELLGPLYELNLPYILGALNGEVQIFERAIPLPDGSIRHSLASYYPYVRDGVVEGFAVQVTDVSQMKRLELELLEARKQAELLATHDSLTGLPNRVLLMDRITNAIVRAEHSGALVAVVAIDFDDFKAVNDTFGHAAGDTVLKETAARMKWALGDTDTLTRLGGDEFVFLRNEVASVGELASAIERIQSSVAQPILFDTGAIIPTLSFGAACFPPRHGWSAAELLAKADAALYEAKRSGKNRLAIAE